MPSSHKQRPDPVKRFEQWILREAPVLPPLVCQDPGYRNHAVVDSVLPKDMAYWSNA